MSQIKRLQPLVKRPFRNTYCPTNNTAAIFYSQSDNPNLTMEVYPIGRVTSDLSIFPDLPSRVDVTFEVVS